MLSLTADDVRATQFSLAGRTRRGYDEGEVDDFLDVVATALDQATARIAELEERLRAAATGPAEPEAAAGLLAMAQRTAEEHVAAARAEAERSAAEAQEQAQGILTEAEAERRQVLGALHYEQQQLAEAAAALRATEEQARAHLQAYLSEVLATVARPAAPQPTPVAAPRARSA